MGERTIRAKSVSTSLRMQSASSQRIGWSAHRQILLKRYRLIGGLWLHSQVYIDCCSNRLVKSHRCSRKFWISNSMLIKPKHRLSNSKMKLYNILKLLMKTEGRIYLSKMNMLSFRLRSLTMKSMTLSFIPFDLQWGMNQPSKLRARVRNSLSFRCNS